VDTQISRLGGPNFHEIPINSPLAQVHNNQRDGMHRQAIPRGRVAYEPNSLGGGCPHQAGMRGFVSYAEPLESREHKVRGKPERFADHYTQATLFWNSQSEVEKQHIIRAFRFELTRVQVPAVRERMVSSLMNVARELADAVATGLGINEMPAPMPKAMEKRVRPEVTESPTLSLLARPGEGGIRTRKIAILIADGVDSETVASLYADLTKAGAVPRYVAPTLGIVDGGEGPALEADITLEGAPPVLFDALILPPGAQAVTKLASIGQTIEFVKDQYRHCKPILALGESIRLLERARIPRTLPSGEEDAALIVTESAEDVPAALHRFIDALSQHRNFARDSDPPAV
jgi:catalase